MEFFETKHTSEDLKIMQSWPLDRKIRVSQLRIMEWYERNHGNVYVSLSGKDSHVLLDLVRRIYPDVPALFVDTGLEYPELRQFIRSEENVTIVRPTMRFDEVISRYGYPIISKEVAEAIYYARRITTANGGEGKTAERKKKEPLGLRTDDASSGLNNWRRMCLTGNLPSAKGESMFNKSKWLPVARDLPIPVSHYCCTVMKKRPAHHYAHQTGQLPIIGTMAAESRVRKQAWLRKGCNAFGGRSPSSQPLSFWTEQDVLAYISLTSLPIPAPYGEIITVDKHGNPCDGRCEGCKYKCTGASRTGCIFCAFGAHSESKKEPGRFQRLAITHPKQYEYSIGGGQWVDNPAYDPTASMEPDAMGWVNWNPKKIWVPSKEGLGMGKVFDLLNEIYGTDFIRYK